jgi:thiazole/oxazole-forming peptide maturase SagD family component
MRSPQGAVEKVEDLSSSVTTIESDFPFDLITGRIACHFEGDLRAQRGPMKARYLSPEAWIETPIQLNVLHDRLQRLSSTICGLAAVVTAPRWAMEADRALHVSVARFSLPDVSRRVSFLQDNWCHGAAPTQSVAETIAIVEAVERYCGVSPPMVHWTGSTEEATEPLVAPSELTLFSERQYAESGFAFKPVDKNTAIDWTWGFDVVAGCPVLVPTFCVWYGYTNAYVRESSSGVAAHSSRDQALVNATLELIERDAFMIHWLNRLSPPAIGMRDLPEGDAAIVRGVEDRGYVVHCLDITTDLDIPVTLALAVRQDGKRPALLVGAGASMDCNTALSKALGELGAAALGHSAHWVLPAELNIGEVFGLSDGARAYEHPGWLRHAEFLWKRALDAEDESQRWPRKEPPVPTDLVAHLAERGYRVIGIDITTKDVASSPLKVVRSLVPGLQPLWLSGSPRLGGRRIYDAPNRMGHRSALCEGDLYLVPHCFP